MEEQTVEGLVKTLSGMNVLELSRLKKALEEAWGVDARPAGQLSMVVDGGAGGDGKGEDGPTEFNVILDSVPDDKKIAVIKVIKTHLGVTLSEAKELATSAPKTVKEGLPKAEAEDLQKKLIDAGASVKLEGQ